MSAKPVFDYGHAYEAVSELLEREVTERYSLFDPDVRDAHLSCDGEYLIYELLKVAQKRGLTFPSEYRPLVEHLYEQDLAVDDFPEWFEQEYTGLDLDRLFPVNSQ